jgi:hypothetical protein
MNKKTKRKMKNENENGTHLKEAPKSKKKNLRKRLII